MNISDIYSNLPPLETERVTLRKLHPNDRDDMYAWASDPEVAQYVTWYAHPSPKATASFIDIICERYKHAKIAPWALVHRQNNSMIGLNGFCAWDTHHHKATLAYVLSKPYWGQGYTTETTRAIIQFGFENMALNRIDARCRIENIGSARVMEKCGLTYEGTLREVAFVKNEFIDLKLYAITKTDWQTIQNNK